MSNTMQYLPAEVQQTIEKQAKEATKTFIKEFNITKPAGHFTSGYLTCATEYASKLHLLQQEYDRILAFSEDQAVKINEMRQHRDNLQGQVEKMQQEYDKLKGENRMLETDHYEIKGKYESLEKVAIRDNEMLFHLAAEHAALKEKAEKMAAALKDIAMGTPLPQLIAQHALSSKNSINNQNEDQAFERWIKKEVKVLGEFDYIVGLRHVYGKKELRRIYDKYFANNQNENNENRN